MLRNSTRQPMGDLGGGGLNLSVCQLVDWMFWLVETDINACPTQKKKGAGNEHTSKWSVL